MGFKILVTDLIVGDTLILPRGECVVRHIKPIGKKRITIFTTKGGRVKVAVTDTLTIKEETNGQINQETFITFNRFSKR